MRVSEQTLTKYILEVNICTHIYKQLSKANVSRATSVQEKPAGRTSVDVCDGPAQGHETSGEDQGEPVTWPHGVRND